MCDHVRQLADAHVEREVPRLPQRMLVGGRHGRIGDGRAAERLHDALGEQEVAKEARHEQILAEELLKELAVEHIPRNGVRDGREYPVELALHRASVAYLARYLGEHVGGEARHQLDAVLLRKVPVQRRLYGRRQARREQVERQLGVHGQQLVAAARRQVNRVADARHRQRRRRHRRQQRCSIVVVVVVVVVVISAVCVCGGYCSCGHSRGRGGHALQVLVLAVLFELEEALYDEARIGAVPDVDGGRAHPGLDLVERERYVLGELLVEDPDLAVGGRLGHAVAVVVEEHALVLGILAQRHAQLAHVLGRRIQAVLVAGARLPALVLLLQLVADELERSLRRCQRLVFKRGTQS